MDVPDLPLRGILVADLSRVLAGPLATMTLGDLGAEVIKVERPGSGDDTRAWGPPWLGEGSTYYLTVNRNKRSIILDLDDPGDRGLAERLATRADVVVENFRAGYLAARGLGAAEVRRQNPRAVYCTISGFGSSGAAAGMPGYDFLVQAVCGLMSVTGEPDGPPLKTGVAVVDMIAGLYATIGILAALRRRERTGSGATVEVSLMDAGLAALLNQASAFLNAGASPQRMGNRHPSIAPYQVFAAADAMVAVTVGSDRTWRGLCDALAMNDMRDDPRFATNAARVANADALTGEIERRMRERAADDWVRRLSSAGVPAGRINTVPEAFQLAAQLGLDSVVETPFGPGGGTSGPGEAVRTVRSPVRIDGKPLPVRTAPPGLDADGAAIRRWLEQP